MSVEWAVGIVVPIFKGKGDTRNCCCCGAMKLLEHGMKVVERVFEKMLCRIVYVDEIHFGFVPEIGTIDAVFILRRMQEEYYANGIKLHMCFVDLEIAFDRVSRKEGVGMGNEEERNPGSFGCCLS